MSVVSNAILTTTIQCSSWKLQAKSSFDIVSRHMYLNLPATFGCRCASGRGRVAHSRVVAFYHPPYSPDLTLADFFQFSHTKWSLKKRAIFGTLLSKQCDEVLNAIPKKNFFSSFQKLCSRCEKCIANDRYYFGII